MVSGVIARSSGHRWQCDGKRATKHAHHTQSAIPPTRCAASAASAATAATQGEQIYHRERLKCEQAAAAGDVAAMNKLGEYYRDALGVARDYTKARDWWEKATAEGTKGSTEAMNNLGDLYERGGYGIQEDDAKAIVWF